MVTVMSGDRPEDPAERALLAELAAARRDAAAVPRRVLEAGWSAFAWNERYADVEFAALAYDSATDREPALTRTEFAGLRELIFESTHHRIELELTGSVLRGQLVPAQAAAVEVLGADGPLGDTATDGDGWFVLRPTPAVPFRLRFRPDSGGSVLTPLIRLDGS
jgi:hypothetical protein